MCSICVDVCALVSGHMAFQATQPSVVAICRCFGVGHGSRPKTGAVVCNIFTLSVTVITSTLNYSTR